VNLLVDFLACLGLESGHAFLPLGELSGEFGSVFLLQFVHVSSNVTSIDSVSKDLWLVRRSSLLTFTSLSSFVGNDLNLSFGVTWESLGVMGNVNTSIASSLKDTEDSGTSGGSLDSNIHKGLEWSLVLDVSVDVVEFSIDFGVSFVHIRETDLLEESSSEKETSAVSSGEVGKTSSETESLELGGLSSAENLISSHGGEDDLSDELGASSSDNESILLGVVLVLSLHNKSSSGVVVGLSLSSSLWLDLHSLGVCLILDDFNESLS
jgi:hypothetical protein